MDSSMPKSEGKRNRRRQASLNRFWTFWVCGPSFFQPRRCSERPPAFPYSENRGSCDSAKENQYFLDAHRTPAVGVNADVISSYAVFSVLEIIVRRIVLMPVQMDRSSELLIPFRDRIVEQDDPLSLIDHSVIIFDPFKNTFIKCDLIQKVVVISSYHKLLPIQSSDDLQGLLRPFHRQISEDIDLIVIPHSLIPVFY